MTVDDFLLMSVEAIPPSLAEGVLYFSQTHMIAVHLCACGCRNRVATPLNLAQWQLKVGPNGASLEPSVGNWGFPCRSHYFIKNGHVEWCLPWTSTEIAAGAIRDAAELRSFFASRTMAGRLLKLFRTFTSLLRKPRRRT